MKLSATGIIVLICSVFLHLQGKAQTDTSSAELRTKKKGGMLVTIDSTEALSESSKMATDSSSNKKVKKEHSPSKAALYSAILPGLGQVYNRKYWKVPIIGVGAGALIYGLNFNQSNFSMFKQELIKRQQGLGNLDPDLDRYSDANLNELQDFYRRNRDLTIVGLALLYALNIIDATVDAHLFEFNVDDDLSMKFSPAPIFTATSSAPALGLGIKLSFK